LPLAGNDVSAQKASSAFQQPGRFEFARDFAARVSCGGGAGRGIALACLSQPFGPDWRLETGMKRMRLTAPLLALAMIVLASSAQALTLTVVGGPGLDGGAVCDAADVCPGLPLAWLQNPAAVVGSFTYDEGTSTVDLTLTLIQDATFSDEDQLSLAYIVGTTFSANDVPVTTSPVGGGGLSITQAGAATGSASPFLLSVGVGGSAILETTPAVSGLTCTIFPGVAGHCGVSFGPSGLVYTLSGEPAHSLVAFNVSVVPEPGTLLLLAAGIAGLAHVARSRRA
jgi:hypothetical protein